MNKGYLTFVHFSTFHLIPAGFEPATVRLEGEEKGGGVKVIYGKDYLVES